jgi:tRNA (uracil-5-)-methyltransferase
MSDCSPELYQQQLEEKRHRTLEEFAEFGISDLDVFASPWQHYRMRAEFKAWHQDNQVHYAMFRADKSRQVYTLDHYPPGSPAIQALMPALREVLNADETLRRKLFQVEFLTSSTGQALVTLIYHRPLDEHWQNHATQLAALLNIQVVGRSRNQKRVLERDFVLEEFNLDGRTFVYQQLEGSFTQPNAAVCTHMLNWAVEHSRHCGGDLLELYCGNGNFTLPLSRNFGKVLATEVAKPAIHSALYNCQLNQIENITFVRMSSEDISGALNRVRSYERLKDIDLTNYQFSTVFVDPPRAGLDPATLLLLQGFNNIIYISCNPHTLKENLRTLSASHQITRLALFDQFPFTEHRECGVILRKRVCESA